MLIRFLLLSAAAIGVVLGWGQLFRFSSTPGEQSAAPAQLPADLPMLQAAANRPRLPLLLVFLHPQCSCTRATLTQLDQILERSRVPVDLELIVYRPMGARGEAALAAASLLHRPARILPDTGGALASRFGASTSGEIVLYSPAGQRLFQGGITPERDHVGDSFGGDALRAALTTGAAQAKPFSVFGCAILSPGHAS